MSRSILIILLMVSAVSIMLMIGCFSQSKNAIEVSLISDKIIIHSDIWIKDITMNICDTKNADSVPFIIDTKRGKLYIYNPCCYLKSFETATGNIADSVRINCYNGESFFEINTYNDFIVFSSNQRIWLFNIDNLTKVASLIDTINEYKPIIPSYLYSFVPVITEDSLLVVLNYKANRNDSTFTYKVHFNKSFNFPDNPNFSKIPKYDFVAPSVEDTVR
jgi:hypothetical protein